MTERINDDSLTVGENTYIVDVNNERINAADRARLLIQESLVNTCIDQTWGLLPARYVPKQESALLDLCCGMAAYDRAVAHLRPDLAIVGIDNNKEVIHYNLNHEDTKQNPNLNFECMNILDPLSFADESFDYVHARFLVGVIPKDRWTAVLKECMRVLKPGGYIRLVECEWCWASEAPSYWRACDLMATLMYQRGRAFSQHTMAVTPLLPYFVRAVGCDPESVLLRILPLDWSYGTPLHQALTDDVLMGMQILRDAILDMSKMSTGEYDQLYQDVQSELNQETFRAIWPLVSVEARKPA
jgi:ubiquinone/menaquinone biosynthesis C-methylase UbiE